MAGRKKCSDDERIQKWIEWYERNREKIAGRKRQGYSARSDAESEAIRATRREKYRKLAEERVRDGWAKPRRRLRTDSMMYRDLLISMLIQRDGRQCGICGAIVNEGEESPDHIIQRSDGGPDTAENLRLTHRTCNNRRPRGSTLLKQQAASSLLS